MAWKYLSHISIAVCERCDSNNICWRRLFWLV